MTEWIAVITITLLAVISPGPDFAMVSRNALTLSRRAGLLTAVGIGLGVLVHVGYTLLGVGLLIRETPALFDLLKLVGAAYLVRLGVGMLASRPAPPPADPTPAAATSTTAGAPSDLGALRTGFLTNALNPKTTIFIVSLFLQVVGTDTPLATRLAYGLFIALAHVGWFAAVGLFLGAAPIRHRILGMRHWIDRVFGLALVGFGLALGVAGIAGG
ncbi:LysE family transporter [Frigidibacter sp. MR17.24]|uniref:LysE family transporter n=1 Tax=Frigidibacter sp. MR17.24 TaxID=3127345 RepID=UPI003012FED4